MGIKIMKESKKKIISIVIFLLLLIIVSISFGEEDPACCEDSCESICIVCVCSTCSIMPAAKAVLYKAYMNPISQICEISLIYSSVFIESIFRPPKY